MGLCRLRTHGSLDWYHKSVFGESIGYDSVAARACTSPTPRSALGNAHDAMMQDHWYTIY